MTQQQRANTRLAHTPLNVNLDKELAAEEERVANLRARLEKITGGGKVVDPHEKAKLEKKYAAVRREWVNRKRKVGIGLFLSSSISSMRSLIPSKKMERWIRRKSKS